MPQTRQDFAFAMKLRCHILDQRRVWRREHFFDDAYHIEAEILCLVDGAHATLSQHSGYAIPVLQQLVYLEHFFIMAQFNGEFQAQSVK